MVGRTTLERTKSSYSGKGIDSLIDKTREEGGRVTVDWEGIRKEQVTEGENNLFSQFLLKVGVLSTSAQGNFAVVSLDSALINPPGAGKGNYYFTHIDEARSYAQASYMGKGFELKIFKGVEILES